MRSGRGPQVVGHGDGAGDAGAEPDAVVGARHVVVHGLGNGDHLEAFLVKAHAVAQRVIAADGNQEVDPQPGQILQHLGRQVVFFFFVCGLQVGRDIFLLHLPGIGARAVQESSAGAAGAVDQLFGQGLNVVAVVVVLLADNIDQSAPSSAHADHLVALAQRADGDSANRRIQARHVAAPGQNSDDTLLRIDVCHFSSVVPFASASLNYAAFRITLWVRISASARSQSSTSYPSSLPRSS